MGFRYFIPLFILFLAFSQSRQHKDSGKEFIGIKMRPIYERELSAWALKQGASMLLSPDWYPIKIRLGSEWRKAKLRVRGDLARHWKNPIKSFRIRLVNTTWKGMTEFDLIIPQDKGYELEAVAYEIAKRIGLPTQYYEFVDVQLNHKRLGIYFLVERWTESSFKSRNLISGEIISENNAWLNAVENNYSLYKNVAFNKDSFNPMSLEPAIYKAKGNRTSSQLAMTKFAAMLREMKHSLENGSPMDWGQYLDRNAAINWAALVIFLGSVHPTFGDNLRWYYSTSSKVFTPLVYDVLAFKREINPGECLEGPFKRANAWLNLWFQNPEMKADILAKVKWLYQNQDFNFDTLWKEVERKFDLFQWHGMGNRDSLRQSINQNIDMIGGYLQRDDCQ